MAAGGGTKSSGQIRKLRNNKFKFNDRKKKRKVSAGRLFSLKNMVRPIITFLFHGPVDQYLMNRHFYLWFRDNFLAVHQRSTDKIVSLSPAASFLCYSRPVKQSCVHVDECLLAGGWLPSFLSFSLFREPSTIRNSNKKGNNNVDPDE